MGKSLLDIIAENERLRVQQKNLGKTDDVLKSPFREYGNSFGRFANQNYVNDKNFESPSVNEVGDKTLLDTKEFNLFPQENYERVDVDLGDSSVIDMPSIDDISENIYTGNLKYNKFINTDYIPYEVEDAKGVKNQFEDYGDYIENIKRDLETRGFTLADIFTGNFNNNDSPIGIIGGQALNTALNLQFSTNLKRETLGRVNTNAFSIFQTGKLFRPDYDITVRRTPLASAAQFLLELQGVELPFSYLPKEIFGFERTKVVSNDGKVTYVGSNFTFEERLQGLLQYTGKGQQKHLINLMNLNLYNPRIEGKFETLEGNEYLIDYGSIVGAPNAKDFIVTFSNSVDSGRGAYEPYGVVSIHKRPTVGKIISDKFQWQWVDDVSNEEAIGWVDTGGSNRFNPKSLLFKTQEVINNSLGFASFTDMSAKEFIEVKNGEAYVISRGDSTTASDNYIADDGTQVSKGDFFRVWTKNRGYNKLSRTLRHRGLDNGDKRSVLNDNGLINFAPTIRRNNSDNALDDVIKRYMFSIENLAWADNMDDLPLCEQGVGDPVTGTRGRIMWFPPYDLKISESSTTNWENTQFIGRGEPIYTYNSTERSGTLQFTIIVDHPDIVHNLVGEKTEFWERYFKGDKAVTESALAQQLVSKRLSQNEIDELEKRRKILPPKEKNDDEERVTENKKKNEQENATKEKEEEGGLGEVAFSIYFPNNVTVVPRSPFLENEDSGDANITLVPDPNLTLSVLKDKNVGYEDGGQSDGFNIITRDGYKIQTTNGIRYIGENGTAINKTYTYDKGRLIDNTRVCGESNAPRGYSDENNFGLNLDFYFFWRTILAQQFENAKKVQVSFVGNASGAAPTGDSNSTLSQKRANNALSWFKNNAIPYFNSVNPDLEILTDVAFKGDTEDIEKIEQGLSGCQDCDRADERRCKVTRRVDIYIKVLEEDGQEPEPIIPSSGDTTIDDVTGTEPLTPSTEETNSDPEGDDISGEIDPNILKKLVYTECDFFEYLELNDPIAYQTISERIKYFMPAYHSMTPQGFNSRLTFLQQCLRQGDSIGRDGIENWKNLAFGRPPVCILRIGDFFHTRIIIESLNIDYEQTWDMNPEGVGVQPMYANVTLNIKILGGSSMSAPINRLQNALSFNYYANTEMFDARADSVVFTDRNTTSEDGKVDDSATYGTLKNGRIVDGIRLSSITNYSDSEKQQKLAKLRKQSRITLENSTTAPTENIETLGQVESLLELKKNLGLPLTDTEKVQQRTSEATKNKFSTTEIEPITVTEVQTTLKTSLAESDSPLNLAVQQSIEQGEETDETILLSYFDQFLSATVTNPDNLTNDYKKQVTNEYIEAYNAIYLDFD